MCLIASGGERVAEEDIPVVKYLRKVDDGGYETPCQWEYVHESEISGFMPFVARGMEVVRRTFEKDKLEVSGGFVHSFREGSLEAALFNLRGELECFRCVIPKGTRYWVSETEQEYASKSLKFVKKC